MVVFMDRLAFRRRVGLIENTVAFKAGTCGRHTRQTYKAPAD